LKRSRCASAFALESSRQKHTVRLRSPAVTHCRGFFFAIFLNTYIILLCRSAVRATFDSLDTVFYASLLFVQFSTALFRIWSHFTTRLECV